MKKIRFWGSIASVIGLTVTLSMSLNAEITSQDVSGNKNISIGKNEGAITINYGSDINENITQQLILHNRVASSSLVISAPSIKSTFDKSKHVCLAISGTPIEFTGETISEGFLQWKRVKITGGECNGKIGWASHELLAYK